MTKLNREQITFKSSGIKDICQTDIKIVHNVILKWRSVKFFNSLRNNELKNRLPSADKSCILLYYNQL